MYRYAAGSGRITVRDLWRGSRSVDLTRLASATAPERPEKLVQRLAGRRHFLVLQDDQGQNVKLNFYGTQRGARRQLLAAIEPYVMADGVSRTGAVRAAWTASCGGRVRLGPAAAEQSEARPGRPADDRIVPG